jgi:nucleotide-binding universal stress UspA family protein
VVAADVLQESVQPFHHQMHDMARSASVVLETEIRIGKPFAEILAARERSTSDLIVVGRSDDAHLGRALVGGVAQKVLGLSEHPVLVLHS